MRQCNRCGEVREDSEFYRYCYGPLKRICKVCERAAALASWYRRKRHEVRTRY